MSKSISKNYIYNVSYQLLLLITPFITTPYLSRVLEPAGIGTYSYTYSIVSYFILLASLGVADYAQREIAYHQDDAHLQSRTFYEVNLIRFLLVGLSLCIYYFVVSSFSGDHLIYWYQALNIIAVLFDISWFFQGLEEFGKIVLRNFIIKFASIVLIFVLIHLPYWHDECLFRSFYLALSAKISRRCATLGNQTVPEFFHHHTNVSAADCHSDLYCPRQDDDWRHDWFTTGKWLL